MQLIAICLIYTRVRMRGILSKNRENKQVKIFII